MENEITVEQVAEYFNVTARTIQNWVLDGMPRTDRGVYNLKKCIHWYVAQSETKIKELKNSVDDNLRDKKLYESEIDIKRKEVGLKKDLAQLLDKKETIIVLTNLLNQIKQNYNGLKHDLRRELELNDDQNTLLENNFENTNAAIAKIEIETLFEDDESLMDLTTL